MPLNLFKFRVNFSSLLLNFCLFYYVVREDGNFQIKYFLSYRYENSLRNMFARICSGDESLEGYDLVFRWSYFGTIGLYFIT